MPTAKKLKSGSWNCRVFSHYEYTADGRKKRVYESFTCADPSKRGKKECERMAAEWSYMRRERGQNITVREALTRYINAKEAVLSPSTIAGYRKYLNGGSYADIEHLFVRDLTQRRVQEWISGFASAHSPKYTKNAYRLLAPALVMAGGEEFRVSLPASRDPDIYTPSDAELEKLLEYLAAPDKYELRIAVMLAAFGSLRRSEVCALEVGDFHGNSIRISKAMVKDTNHQWQIKQPKTARSARTVVLPQFVVDMISFPEDGRILTCNPDALSNRFRRAVRSAGMQQEFSFHSLRHYYVSIAHVLQIGDAYTMKMGGWRTDYVMKKNYRSTLSDAEKKAQKKMNDHFSKLVHHDMHHKRRKAQ